MKKAKQKRKIKQAHRSEREILNFIESAWRQLAALAYRQFLERGKGAIVLNLTTATAKNLEPNEYQVEAKYFALSDEKMPKEIDRFRLVETIGQIAEHNPQSEIVIIVLTEHKANSLSVACEPTPPAAFLSHFSRPKKPGLENFN